MEHKKIEKNVLEVYRNVSPSYRKLENVEDFKKNYIQRKNILNELCLTEQLFAGKKVIDIGGGTGENSIFYVLWGSEVTILEPNKISSERAKELFKQFGKKLTIINDSLFDYKVSGLKGYDIVICEGVLHHTYDPIKGLDLILSNLKPNSIAIIAICEYHGWYKRHLQRKLVLKLAGNEEEKIVKVSKKYFQNHINRAVKYGLRTEESVIYDTFVNPQIKRTKLKNICDCFIRNRMLYLSAYPSLVCFFQTQPWGQARENKFNYAFYQNYYKLLEKIWMVSGEENFHDDLKNFNLDKFIERVNSQVNDLLHLEKKIENNSFNEAELSVIQNGYMGIGLNYFVGQKI